MPGTECVRVSYFRVSAGESHSVPDRGFRGDHVMNHLNCMVHAGAWCGHGALSGQRGVLMVVGEGHFMDGVGGMEFKVCA